MLLPLFPALTFVLGLTALPAAADAPQRPSEEFDKTQLTAAQTIEDVPCGPGLLWKFADTGTLHRCTLDRDATVRGAALPKGTVVAFHPDGTHQFAFLAHDTTIEGTACKGSGDGFMTTFHPNGRLKLCWLPQDAMVQGVPCASFTVWSDIVRRNQSGVLFHPNGQLAECRLSQAIKKDGQSLQKGEHIHLDQTGRAVPPGGA